MLHVDIPTLPEFKALNEARADACVSIYIETTPLSLQTDASRIELGNLAKAAREQLESKGFDKRRAKALFEQIEDLAEDDSFWRLQANGLGVLATADSLRTFRLAEKVQSTVQVSDRFHLKPLIRALTYPSSAFVLGLSENKVRLIEVYADLAAVEIDVPGMPSDAASALGKATLNDRSHDRRIVGSEGQNVRFRQFVRIVDNTLRPLLAGYDTPMILAATGRLEATFRQANSYPHLLAAGIQDSTDRWTLAELSTAARPLIDAAYAAEIAAFRDLFAARGEQGRAAVTLEDAARAATYGAIESLVVDIDADIPGTIDESSGKIQRAEAAGAATYGLTDEIAGRALATGAKVYSVHRDQIPGGGELAAILRYPV